MNKAFKRQRERKRTLENTYKDNISIKTGLKMQGELVCSSRTCQKISQGRAERSWPDNRSVHSDADFSRSERNACKSAWSKLSFKNFVTIDLNLEETD